MALTTIESSGAASLTITDGTAEDQASSCYDTDFRQRLYIVATLAAISVLLEDPGTTGHASRSNYARQVLSDPVTLVNRSMVFAVVADGITGTGSTDQAIGNRVGDLWNALSSGY